MVIEGNIERWRGFAEAYDRVRPAPPDALLERIVHHVKGAARLLDRVVDVGAGTGLSTLPWSPRAKEVLGIEPSEDMRRVALDRVARAGVTNVRISDGLATATGLSDASVDVITCSQCLHWLEPEPTFAEFARVLRPGGVFAAYDYDWPPLTGSWRVDAAYAEFMERATAMERVADIPLRAHKWEKSGHADRMRASGRFAAVHDVVVDAGVEGDAERFLALALTQGGPATLHKLGVSVEELGVPALEETVRRALGTASRRWLLRYRLRVGIR